MIIAKESENPEDEIHGGAAPFLQKQEEIVAAGLFPTEKQNESTGGDNEPADQQP
ncbi:MAG TPA: hypothetical protein PKO38_08930 [Bacillota bacterium]|nr:hypothetical protein [Bacillota bacterium]